MTTPIPSPPSVPFLGHTQSIDRDVPILSYQLLSKQYGEIFELNLAGRHVTIICTQELLHEVSDEKRFRKVLSPSLNEVRNAAGDGLFTAHLEEPNWGVAHRILMPAFSTMNVRNMFDDMVDVVNQLCDKWERFGPYHKLDPAQDFTALTLEAITFCAMSYRMNAFYVEGLHPFAKALADFLFECNARSMRLGVVKPFMRAANAKYEEDKTILVSYVNDILEYRKANPTDKKDILNIMLNGVDKETGQKLSDQSIKNNLLIFLIAGHETTSGMLTFIMYYLLKNPEAMLKLRKEVDTLIGSRAMTIDDVHKLPYLLAVMREALRLGPPAPMRGAAPWADTTLKGKYPLAKDSAILCAIYLIHRDPKVWGEDVDEFRPERMLDGKFEALPPDSWQPFGYGMRGCIGRPFAWQEVQIVLVKFMQRFTFVLDDPSYDLKYKQTMSIKPKDFYIHVLPRTDKKPSITPISSPSSTLLRPHEAQQPVFPSQDAGKQPMYVLYGSNTGTSEAFAQRIASDASGHGFRARIGTLDSAAGHLPTDGPVVIVTASFEGQPADNAVQFVEWIKTLQGDALSQVTFAVFGSGNRDWALTYQRIPTFCDETLAARGAKRLTIRGEGDAGSSEFFDAFDKWGTSLWEALQQAYGTKRTEGAADGLEIQTVETGTTRSTILRQPDATLGSVVDNKILTSEGVPAKRHIEFDLPEGLTFRTGDYLAILPVNPQRDGQRALAHFGLLAEQEITITTSGPTPLPTGRPINVFSLLSGYVELSQPASTRDLRTLAGLAKSEVATAAIQQMTDAYAEEVLAKRLSLLDILEDIPGIKLSFGAFLQLLPSMRVRQYSISSSPLANPQRVTLTISVLEAPAISGRREPFLGVASTYLAGLRPGDKVQLAIRPSNAAFHPPSDPKVPLVMFCAGSGLAPMRGFLQERAIQKNSGREVAKSLLFFGCRSPSQDYLYADSDLKEWIGLGIVDVRPAFSRATGESSGCKYVQDRVWNDRDEVLAAWDAGAKLYLCGSSKMANSVKDVLVRLVGDRLQVGPVEAKEKFNHIINGRFATDVFE